DPLNAEADFRTPTECAPDRYDAAILAVPNDAKIDLIRYFLERGKPVLVEKPLLLEPDAADLLAAIAARTGTIWYTASNCRFEPPGAAPQARGGVRRDRPGERRPSLLRQRNRRQHRRHVA